MAGNILAFLVLFAKSTNIFLRQKIALYGNSSFQVVPHYLYVNYIILHDSFELCSDWFFANILQSTLQVRTS